MCLVPKLNYNSALTYYYRMGMWGLVLGTREPIIALDINLRHCNTVTAALSAPGPGSGHHQHRGDLVSGILFSLNR